MRYVCKYMLMRQYANVPIEVVDRIVVETQCVASANICQCANLAPLLSRREGLGVGMLHSTYYLPHAKLGETIVGTLDASAKKPTA